MAPMRRFLILIAALGAIGGARAEEMQAMSALAMHGEPAYPATMTHFAYARRSAAT